MFQFFLNLDANWKNTFALGMENHLILDSQLTASSSKYSTSDASNSRLNANTIEGSYGGWIAADNDTNPWLQVDFIVETSVSAIRVQVVDLLDHSVSSFTVSYGNNLTSLAECKDNGLAKVSGCAYIKVLIFKETFRSFSGQLLALKNSDRTCCL